MGLENTPPQWSMDKPFSTWHGVSTTSDGEFMVDVSFFDLGGVLNLSIMRPNSPIVALNLSSNNIVGAVGLLTLPPKLAVLDISHNKFFGAVDLSVAFAGDLDVLLLNSNALTGVLNASALPALLRANFSDNLFELVVAGDCAELVETLRISQSQFCSSPSTSLRIPQSAYCSTGGPNVLQVDVSFSKLRMYSQ